MKSVIQAAAVVFLVTLGNVSFADAGEPGWSPVIVARGEYRQQIRSLPIQQRPYRPLHFYGNTVRRMHYRGTPAPLLREVATPVIVQRSRFDTW
ncbi:hypothetical protein [Allorhodopirellula solitaria]|uniref:Uncharacterized protein n=1 Tax=Allorhodopirellula solitaria TaxID=2527987 RepID=A0A5C5XSD9_9BACT|nr:hypothetical protein [Allorhodopirellula solitaria]TWT66166.1 hypothetical protein CA85_30300 [Allorhodopirellula solitaria]